MPMQRARQDLADFEQRLRGLALKEPSLASLLAGVDEWVLARAPGRLDVMGGFADYSGSLVLEMPIAEAACVAAARTAEPWIEVVSLGEQPRRARFVAAELWSACVRDQVLHGYFEALDPVFALIRECEDGRDVMSLLKGPVAHSGFTRLN